VNRLTGVIIGFFIIALTWQSGKFRKADPEIFRTSVAILILVIFQGWFGSIVVSTNLTTWTITVHMFLALLIVVLLASLQNRSNPSGARSDKKITLFAAAALILLFIQVFLGTEVRTAIDRVSSVLPRNEWIGALGTVFVTHRTFSWVVLIAQLILIRKIRKTPGLNTLSLPLIILILGAFLTGVGMAYLGVPAVLQPLHLTLASIAIGTEALLIFRTNGSNN